mmetsp:Transcript_154629/g.281067  ORF Transcript_154629/g.281067 Transcript_154629/m.281067 type:complete len:1106 (-) Transcript_154629:62-3379(-)
MKPARLREALVTALSEGLTLILDLDPPRKGKKEEEQTTVQDIFNPNHFPAELFSKPRAILSPDVYGPLQGRAGAQAAAHFELLGVDSEASIDEIKAAYRSLVKTAHPDKGGDPETFLAIQAAYEALTSGGENSTSSTVVFEPNSAFKLLLLSRTSDAPPPDVAAHCTPIWVSGKQRILMKGYDKPIEALSAKATSVFGIMAELAAEAAFRDHQEFMADREYEDDVQECRRRLVINRKRVLEEQRWLRRQLFAEAVRVRSSQSGEEEALARLEAAQNKLNLIIAAMESETDRVKEIAAAQAKLQNEVQMEQDAIEEAKKKLAQAEKTARQKRERMPARLSSLENKRSSFAAKESEAKAAAGEEQEKLKQEATNLQKALEEAEDMQKQFEAWVQQLEETAKQLKDEVADRSSALYKTRIELSKQQKANEKDCFEGQTCIWEMTKELADKSATAKMKTEQTHEDDVKVADKSSFDEAVFKRVHHAAYSKSLGNSRELVDAAGDGELEKVIKLLEQGYDLESHDATGYTALSEAACTGQEAVVKLLLDLGADPNTFGTSGYTLFGAPKRTPLWRATFNAHLGIMRLLLEQGADPNFVLSGEHALTGTKKGFELLQAGADPAHVEELQQSRQKRLEEQLREFSKDWSAEEQRSYHLNRAKIQMQKLAADGDAARLKELLEQIVSDEIEAGSMEGPQLTADVRDECGRTLLHIASWKGKAQVAEMLLSTWKTARTNKDDPHAEVRQRVLRVDVDARFGPWNNCEGWTALGVAGWAGHADVVEILRRHGANPLLGTEIHEDAFAIMDAAPMPEFAVVIKSIDRDTHMITTEKEHGLSMASGVIYRCGPNTESPMMQQFTMSKQKVKPQSIFFARIHDSKNLTLYDTQEHAIAGKKEHLQRVYDGARTLLIEWQPVHTSMREYTAIDNGFGPMEFLCDRQPIPVVQSKKRLMQLEADAQQAKKRLEIEGARALDARINPPEDTPRQPTGFYIGAYVKLSASGCAVEDDYDWSEDPLRPGEFGEVREPDPEEEAGESEVYVVGPRGDPAFYDPADLELVTRRSSVLPAKAHKPAPKVSAPAPQKVNAQKAEDSSFYNLKLSGSCVPRSFGPPSS